MSQPEITCPGCNKTGEPVARSTEEPSPVELVPLIGDALTAYRKASTRLYCQFCGQQLSDSLIDKSRKASKALKSLGVKFHRSTGHRP